MSLQGAFDACEIRKMLDIIDELRRMGVKNDGIKLPSIVVVGDQSSGKTSVLESLSGIRLPSKMGLCTRVPLILRLTSGGMRDDGTPNTSDRPGSRRDPGPSSMGDGSRYGQEPAHESEAEERERGSGIVHEASPSKIIVIEYDRVMREISEDAVEYEVARATDRLAGSGKDIKDRPITLTVTRHGGPDLTLIDLPGITHVPIGDQPDDIYDQVKRIIKEYIDQEESVILNVLSAAVDFATCESVRMSQEVDKNRVRTLAVVTKIDMNSDGLYDKIISGQRDLKLEFVLVRNRTDRDGSYAAAQEAEARFFQDNPPPRDLVQRDMFGVRCLANKLMLIQAERVRTSFPKIRERLHEQLEVCTRELGKLPPGVSSPADAARMLFSLLGARKDTLERLLIKGDYRGEDKSLHFAPRVANLMTRFDRDLAGTASEFKNEEYRTHVLEVLKTVKGVTLPVFVPDVVFKRLVREEVVKSTKVCEDFIPSICNYAESVGVYAVREAMGGFKALCERATAVTTNVIFQTKEKCLAFVREMLRKATDIVYVDDAHFKDMKRNAFSVIPPASETEEDKTARVLQATLFAYWKIMHKRLAFEIPIQIKFAVQTALMKDVDSQLMDFKSDSGLEMMELMREDTTIYRKRGQLTSRIAELKDKMRLVASM